MVQHTKDVYRKEILEKRKSLTKEQISTASHSIERHLFSLQKFIDAKSVAFYIPIHNEVDTAKMILHASQEKEILVPVTTNRIDLFRFTTFEDLVPAKYGILEPKIKYPPSKNPDVIIIPGVAFGMCMHRIGYGQGYYDELLKRLPNTFKIGLAYEFQILKKLPVHVHDEKMDLIITEKLAIKPGNL